MAFHRETSRLSSTATWSRDLEHPTLPPPFALKNTTFKFDVSGANTLLDDADWNQNGNVRKKDGDQMYILDSTSVNPLRQKEQEIVKAGPGSRWAPRSNY